MNAVRQIADGLRLQLGNAGWVTTHGDHDGPNLLVQSELRHRNKRYYALELRWEELDER